ncbi:MAG TPA: [protein-PII] uridylyltransferase, partial [Rhodoblastus sp.]|nr:[protein-PII] uridylyltransferase [Rhodoblastus sp.]
LWDLKQKVGHSTRSIDECLRQAHGDMTIRTALLEARFILGEQPLFEQMRDRFEKEIVRGTAREFVAAKLGERDQRVTRAGASRYLVEPNVKEGKGGLRDLNTLFWIGKYVYRVREVEELVAAGLFTPQELKLFERCDEFLWRVRCHLHFVAGRAEERLSFDKQRVIAERLGYVSHAGLSGVERFMKHYFLVAKDVGDLTAIVCAALEEKEAKPRAALDRFVGRFRRRRKLVQSDDFAVEVDRVTVARPDVFDADPVNLIRLFWLSDTHGLAIHPDALRLVTRSLRKIDAKLRNDPEANRLFLEILTSRNSPEVVLRQMNESGVLGRFIQDFGRIVAMMQFNMYHHYTVDEHIIRTISTLSQIEQGDLIGDLPVSTEILARGVNRRVLYVALLLHDIAKGSGRDHSELGGEIALRLAPRFGLDADETEMVAWLVRNHLLMSDTAQKRDLAEPRTVRDFAQIVKSPNRLKLLTVLTVCDIRGVGPNVWNNWKAMLLRTLYAETLEYLTGGSQSQSRPEREAAAKSALAEALEGWGEDEIRTECARHYAPYWLGFDTRTHAIFADLVRRLPEGEPAIDIELDFGRDATQACFAMSDHPGIFARLAGALALAGANVVDARTYTSTDGIATAAFWIQDAQGAPYERARLARLRHSVGRTLRGEVVAREALKSRDRIKKREKDFVVPTRVHFDNTASDICLALAIGSGVERLMPDTAAFTQV